MNLEKLQHLVFRTNLLVFVIFSDVTLALEQEKPCPPGHHRVSERVQPPYYRADGTAVSGSKQESHCRLNPPHFATWEPRLKVGKIQNWERKNEITKTWKNEEKIRVLNEIGSLPEFLFPKNEISIYRASKDSTNPNNPASGLGNTIVLYDPSFGRKLDRVLAHEFAHLLYRQLYDANSWLPFAKAAGWRPVPNPETKKLALVNTSKVINNPDSINSLDEDFSNSVELFIFEPEKLKKESEELHTWFNKTYGDNIKRGRRSDGVK